VPLRLAGKKVLVVGLARSGAAAARLAAREGAIVTITDRRPAAELADALAPLEGLSPRLVLGGHDDGDFASADLVVVSPGVPLSLPPIAAAVRAGVPVMGEVEMAWRLSGDVPVVAITGTNGKSTTTALTGRLFQEDRATFVGGNLGTPLSELPLSGKRFDVAVLELSSFQLEGTERFRPRVGAVLNLTPDHLDRYAGMEEYAAAKARIFANQQPGDVAVANERDPQALAMARSSRGDVVTFGFGPRAPMAARDDGEVIRWTGPTGEPERYRIRSRALRGRHNRENAMAAIACARMMGVPGPAVQRGLDDFPGLPHRLELVSERGGVEWVNDSKATNVDSTVVGLSAFPAGKPSVVLVLGGRGKRAPYAPLAPLFPGRVKALLTIGEDAPAIERELGGLAPTESCGDLATAVARAARIAAPGDVVLLSPACASYDQFRSYEDRGETFRRLASALPVP
jgi:UDP-N-acetylmuramoylalanine--D-glutamate ligase